MKSFKSKVRGRFNWHSRSASPRPAHGPEREASLRRSNSDQRAEQCSAFPIANRLIAVSLLVGLAWLVAVNPASGQPTNYADENAVAGYVRQMLYWQDADPTNRDVAAFRYKQLLYTNDAGIHPVTSRIASLYGDAERARSRLAEEELERGLTNNPASPVLDELFLDIYYDRTVAEAILAHNTLAGADFIRFAQTSAPPALVIDAEIAANQQGRQELRAALTTYLSLLTNHLGVAGETPLGYQLFQQRVPERGLLPATYLSNDAPVSVITNAGPLFAGYKDLVLLYGLLRDYGRTAKTLAGLMQYRAGPGDHELALNLTADAERYLFLHSELLRGIFPGLNPEAGDPSGLAEAMSGCAQSLTGLGTLREALESKQNALGFDSDFLMLVQKFTGATTYYDSYDALRERLSPANSVGPLAYALADWQQARNSYATYRGNQDQLAGQFEQIVGPVEDRLFQIVGAYPDDPAYATPQNNEGCELWQQAQSIEAARLRIQKNAAEINNLKQEINIELWRANAVGSTYIRYANKQASLTEKIGEINAAQAAANAAADAAGASTIWGAAAQAANAAAQAGFELKKSSLEAEKERQAGLEQAQIEGLESAARVKTLLLGMNTLAIDSQEAVLLLSQEMGRFTALLREKKDLERQLAECPTELAGRYFADPAHALRYQADMLRADLSFDEAQKWMFFMTRALEYKWNQTFTNYNYGGRTWSSASVFKLRNAPELEEMWRAMDAYEQPIAATIQVGANRFDWFSVRKDFFGYQDGHTYQDPITGRMLDPISAFRTNLLRRLVTVGNGQECVIEFDTVRQIPGGFFFVGPVFTTNQPPTVYDPGRFLDKINYLKIRLVGASMIHTNPLAGRLSYGGVSYLRKPRVGKFDSTRPDRLRDEWTTYSTRYWFNLGYGWEFTDRQTVSDAYMERSLVQNPNIPPGTAEIGEFKERSVAATGWRLAIPTISLGQRVLYVDNLDDVIIYFQHRSAQRTP